MRGRRGLYAVADAGVLPFPRLLEAVAEALAGGAVLVQYRDKEAGPAQRLERARALARLCRARGVPLLVNDHPELALAAGAQGVHLGRDDPPVAEARRLLGPGAVIGASCYGELARARAAAAAGADYLAFGACFPSCTKPGAPAVGRPALAAARRDPALAGLPLVAIGGITADNGAALVAEGADLLAVVRGLWEAGEVRAAAARLQALA
ncbi:MAG: thiamine phosphate synthase, partial [Gammaproteobacteria bacterium]